MGLFEQFPYTNFHELNLDWVLQAVKGMDVKIDAMNDYIQDHLDDAIRDMLDTAFIDSIYDAPTETLILVINTP